MRSLNWVFSLVIILGVVRVCPVHAGTDFSPIWLEEYRVRAGGGERLVPNTSYLYDVRVSQEKGDIGNFSDWLVDSHQAETWRQDYENLNRDYEVRSRAGTGTAWEERNHVGKVTDFGQGVVDSLGHKTLAHSASRVEKSAQKNEVIRTAVVPVALAAGIYAGRPIGVRLSDETKMNLSTNFRSRTGSMEVSSPVLHGGLSFRPAASASRNWDGAGSTDFDLGSTGDFSQERYQLSLSRDVPGINVNASLFYAGSSNAFVSSWSKQITKQIACAVDSVHSLNPMESGRSVEEKIRLRYDLRF